MVRRVVLSAMLSLSVATALAADVGQTITVTRAQYGSQWPYPYFRLGVLSCSSLGGGRYAVSIRLGSTTYGLNGTAREEGLPDSRTKMRRDKDSGAYDLGATDDIIRTGLKLCGTDG